MSEGRWIALVNLRQIPGRFAAREAAMRECDGWPMPWARAVRNLVTGERWEWRRGTWVQSDPPESPLRRERTP